MKTKQNSEFAAKRFPQENWQRLVSDERAQWQEVAAFLRVAQPRAKEVWLDFGCGPGYFSLPLAKHVWSVIAVDVSEAMLVICRQRAAEERLKNIEFLVADDRQFPLAGRSIDRALLANIFHELDEPQRVLLEIRRLLKEGGKVLLIDWKPIETPTGPPLDHRVAEHIVIDTLENAGFAKEQSWDIFPFHYVLSFVSKR